MEHEVIHNFKAVNRDRTLFLKWRQKFTTAFGQVNAAREEIVHRTVREIDLGKDLETIVFGLRNDYGAVLQETSSDI